MFHFLGIARQLYNRPAAEKEITGTIAGWTNPAMAGAALECAPDLR
jgi:hypothetical protein